MGVDEAFEVGPGNVLRRAREAHRAGHDDRCWPALDRRGAAEAGRAGDRSSRGIGRAIADRARRRTASSSSSTTPPTRPPRAETLAAIKAAGGSGALSRFDVADAAAVDAAVKQIATEHGRLDVLVNNAGIAIDGAPAAHQEGRLAAHARREPVGRVPLCKAASRYLLKADDGRIVNISSVVGEIGQRRAGRVRRGQGRAHRHDASRSRASSRRARSRSTASTPGFIETDMTAGTCRARPARRCSSRSRSGASARAEDVADAVRFLVSPRASYSPDRLSASTAGF